jgi:hypothetical protein
MEEKNENVVEETTQDQTEQVEQVSKEEVPQFDESKFKSAGNDEVLKIDLSQLPKPVEENETKEDNADDSGVVASAENAESTQEQEEVQPETETQETSVLEEVTEEETAEAEEIAVEAEQAIKENLETGKPLPENIQKLMNFMEETGGDLSDYVKLNQDYSKLDDQSLLHEYYKQTKPHLNNEEINFLMEDTFSYDEEVDEERDIRRKKLALKEQVANAKSHLDGQKSRYYNEIKAGSKLTSEQQQAIDFFSKFNKTSEDRKKVVDRNSTIFEQKTNQLFNDKFKGFEYKVGDKKFRFNIKDVEGIKKQNGNVNNFMARFVDENLALKDAKGYHKGLFTAMNPDAVAKHFYEQGMADAMKDSVAKSKNVDMNPRQNHGKIEAGNIRVNVLGDNSSDFKFKIKNKNK